MSSPKVGPRSRVPAPRSIEHPKFSHMKFPFAPAHGAPVAGQMQTLFCHCGLLASMVLPLNLAFSECIERLDREATPFPVCAMLLVAGMQVAPDFAEEPL